MEDIMEIEIVKSLEDSVFLKNEVLLNRKLNKKGRISGYFLRYIKCKFIRTC